MHKILATRAAEDDLTGIRDYLANTLGNQQAWFGLAELIRQHYITLQEHPFAFPVCHDLRLKRKGYRKCVIGAYLFIYRIDEPAETVHIVRFFHRLQDYQAQL